MEKTITNKSIDEIINRDDYARLTKALKNRTEEIAVKVKHKMQDLDLDEMIINGFKIVVKKYSANQGQYHFCNLSIKRYCAVDYGGGYYEYLSLEDINESYYAYDDFKCKIEGATAKQALKFLNSAKKIFENLDEIETQQVNDVTKVLEETKDM